MKIFSTNKIQLLDNYTIENEPIKPIDLMERAALKIYQRIQQHFPEQKEFCIFAGPGNNGGDALAIARMLLNDGYLVKIVAVHPSRLSDDCNTNLLALRNSYPKDIVELKTQFEAPQIGCDTVIVDGIFGSGLKRPVDGIFADAIHWINKSGCKILSIDLPSGLMGEENANLSVPIVRANYTFTLQFPKLAFFFAENYPFIGDWEIVKIGIHPAIMEQTASEYYYLEEDDISKIIKSRPKFSHKGTFGHACIVAGSVGMAGASVLSAKAALRSGAGLVTVYGPEANRIIVQTAVPEVIFESLITRKEISAPALKENCTAIAIGPGMGNKSYSAAMLEKLLSETTQPCILDADALNIIAHHKKLLELIPKNSILTPHPKEFERLFGATENAYKRMLLAKSIATKHQLILVLKGAYSLIVDPNGRIYFNSAANSGMATAGSGDVLTGILAGLLAQSYSAFDATLIGVFIHGFAAELALASESEESLMASDITRHLGEAFKRLKIHQRVK